MSTFPSQKYTQVGLHVVQRFVWWRATHWFMHSLSWRVSIYVGRSCQKMCTTDDGSLPDRLQVTSWKTNRTYKNVQDQEVLSNAVGGLKSKTWDRLLQTSFWEIPECTEKADVEWQLFNADVASSVDPVLGRKHLGVSKNGKKQHFGGTKST